jgi:RNA polymerase sigma-70 factor (ECF subfamily)
MDVSRLSNTDMAQDVVEAAFREAYCKYAKRLFNTALRIVGRTEDAEDVLQESFMEAFRNLRSFEGRASMGTWLHRIVVNRSINLLRSRKLILTDAEQEIPEEVQEEEAADLGLQVEKVKLALMQLPIGYKTVLTLHLFEGYDYEEIAQIMGIAPVSVRSQYHRARNTLINIIRQQPSI